jgi:hypothetical protein
VQKSTEPADDSAEYSMVEKESPAASAGRNKVDHDGSVGSHLLFGLGTLAFVSPMLIPGIPLGWLSLAYGGLLLVAVVGYLVWSVFSRLKTRGSRR